jgi:hypothetical protein
MYCAMWTSGSGTVVLGLANTKNLKYDNYLSKVQHAANIPFKTGPFYTPS